MANYDYTVYYRQFHSDTEEHIQRMVKWQRKLIEPHVPTDRSLPVVDIGCGWGFALRALKELGFHDIVGIESSLEQAEAARKAGFNVATPSETSQWLRDNQQRFGFALLMDVLEHIPVDAQIDLSSSIYSSLRPGGRVFVSVPNANAILSSRWRYNDYTHFSSFTEHSLNFVLKNGGFNKIEINAEKGLGLIPKRLWQAQERNALRRWIVRWCWLQVFKAELPWERLENIGFELNLKAVAFKDD
ncbi:MAG TPA: class I SAM-dependent methyltransferase [Verrucomicrobiae bacterium]|jgi:2-polyprenyl-3-methyl-5-hydroxy-6-metoxy-1,4-benzoquinol methylase|nr:class I SAM-dependent methyltransferase [Verrucomicrobiae bacterium]